jgi:hypothetical protein
VTLGIPHDNAAPSQASRLTALALHQSEELFVGAGDTREACRRCDWSASSLGPQADWPPALSSCVLHILWSAFPNLILWGPDLLVFYNDADLDLIGDGNVAALGLPAREVSPRIWALVSPVYSRVLAGETFSHDDAELTITRKGRESTIRRTLSLAPVHDGAGHVRGVLVTVFDSEHAMPARAD